jgi:hypothetical protein
MYPIARRTALGLDDVHARDLGLAARDGEQPAEHPDRRRLSGAVGAEVAEDLSLLHLEGDVIDGDELAEALREGFHANRDISLTRRCPLVFVRPCSSPLRARGGASGTDPRRSPMTGETSAPRAEKGGARRPHGPFERRRAEAPAGVNASTSAFFSMAR